MAPAPDVVEAVVPGPIRFEFDVPEAPWNPFDLPRARSGGMLRMLIVDREQPDVEGRSLDERLPLDTPGPHTLTGEVPLGKHIDVVAEIRAGDNDAILGVARADDIRLDATDEDETTPIVLVARRNMLYLLDDNNEETGDELRILDIPEISQDAGEQLAEIPILPDPQVSLGAPEAFFFTEDQRFLVIADGLGGADGGSSDIVVLNTQDNSEDRRIAMAIGQSATLLPIAKTDAFLAVPAENGDGDSDDAFALVLLSAAGDDVVDVAMDPVVVEGLGCIRRDGTRAFFAVSTAATGESGLIVVDIDVDAARRTAAVTDVAFFGFPGEMERGADCRLDDDDDALFVLGENCGAADCQGFVDELDPATLALRRSIPLGGNSSPAELALHPDGVHALVYNVTRFSAEAPGSQRVVNLETGIVDIDDTEVAWGAVVTGPDGESWGGLAFFVNNGNNGDIQRVAAAPNFFGQRIRITEYVDHAEGLAIPWGIQR